MRNISCLVTYLAIISSLVVVVRSTDIFVYYNDPAITYTPPDDWQPCNCSVPQDGYDPLLSQTVGDSATFSFNGSYIYYYAIVGPNFGQFNITLDGVTNTGTAYNSTEQSPQLLWSSPTQGNQEHIVVLTNADGNFTSLDHFIFTLPPSTSTSTPTRNAIIGGTVGGVFGLSLLVIAIVLLFRFGCICFGCKKKGKQEQNQYYGDVIEGDNVGGDKVGGDKFRGNKYHVPEGSNRNDAGASGSHGVYHV